MSSVVRFSRRLAHWGTALLCALTGLALVGFVQIRFTPTSSGFKWPTTSIRYVIQANGSDDVPDKSDEAALRLAFRSWEQVSDSFVRFSEDTFADRTRTDYTATDIQLIVWDEDGSSGLFPAGSNVIALTPVLASTSDGTILDADIVFNGQLRFTTDPLREASRFDVQAVATHEIGHFLGFDHSGGTFSTMFASIPSGSIYARSLEHDDAAAAATNYGSGATTRGTINGTLTLQGGGQVRYAQVIAVSRATGVIECQALADAQGNYVMRGLRPGTYDLYAEPLNGPYGLGDTIGFKNESSTSFPTTFNPANPVTIVASQTLGASWSVPNKAPILNVSGTAGGRLSLGQTSAMALIGSGLDKVVSAQVSGASVVVEGLSSQSAGGLIVTLSANAGASTGIRTLTLTTSSGEIAVATAGVEVLEASPTISQISPSELKASGGETLTFSGARFDQKTQVVIGGQLATGVIVATDGNSLTCLSPASPGSSAPVDGVVIRTDGREARLRGALTYEQAPAPTSVDPALGPSAGGTLHDILGGGFTSPVQVFFDSVAAEVISSANDKIRVRLPPHAAGAVTVTVVAAGKEGFLTGGFNYVAAAAPTIDSLNPTRGGTGGGTSVTIRGANFEAGSQVRFGGVLANLTQVGGSQLTAVTPAHATGQVEVRVTNPSSGLTSISPSPFTYDDTPPPPPSSSGGKDCQIGVRGSEGPAQPGLALLFLLAGLLTLRLRRPA